MDFYRVFFYSVSERSKTEKKPEGHLTANNALLWKGLCPPKAEEHFPAQ